MVGALQQPSNWVRSVEGYLDLIDTVILCPVLGGLYTSLPYFFLQLICGSDYKTHTAPWSVFAQQHGESAGCCSIPQPGQRQQRKFPVLGHQDLWTFLQENMAALGRFTALARKQIHHISINTSYPTAARKRRRRRKWRAVTGPQHDRSLAEPRSAAGQQSH